MRSFRRARRTSEDQVGGGLVAYLLGTFEQERRETYIYDLAVMKNRRGRGVVTGLAEALWSIAALVGAYLIFVQVDLTDAPASKAL